MTAQTPPLTPSSDTVRFLVHGATGARGGAVAHRLLDQRLPVRVSSHLPHPGAAQLLDALRERGAEVVDADFDVPQSLLAASRGVQRVFLHPPLVGHPDRTLQQMQSALAAATAAGVKKVVLATNSALPEQDSGVPSVEVNRRVEGLLAASGLPSTVLRPTLYLGNLTAPWSLPRIVGAGELAYPLPEHVPVSWLDPDDAADAAVRALLGESDGATEPIVHTLGGPRAILGPDLAATLSAAVGRTVTYVPQSADNFAAGLAPVLGDAAAADVGQLYEYLGARGSRILNVPSSASTPALGRAPRSVEQWSRDQSWN